jgi:hypothetical protein
LNAVTDAVTDWSYPVLVRPAPCVPAVVNLQSFNATAVAVVFDTPISTTRGFTVAEE